jgi:nitrate/TMAO reductase-like tetraheme cytochrome c subunit
MGRDRDKRPKSRVLLEVRIPRLWIGGLLAALALVAIGAVAGFASVNRIETCGACHVIKAEVDTYKETAHHAAGVGCQECHTKPGVFSYFVRNLQGLSNVLAHATDTYERPITAYVGADTCTQCHSNEELGQDLVVGNIRINHKGLREAGYQCLTCHANISHPGTQTEVARLSQNVMAVCSRCHDGVTQPADCDVCHLGAVPGDHEPVTVELKMSAKDCAGCHEDEVACRRCHNGLQMPHPSDWEKSRHGTVVLDRDESICVRCHTKEDPAFCDDCHGLEMPHPNSFRKDHGAAAQKDRKLCVNCHGKNGCTTCHGIAMPHPSGFLATHTGVARSSPAVCSRCHSAAYCNGCHGVSLPHSSSFIAGHANAVYSGGGLCVKCHGNSGSGIAGCYGGECHVAGDDFDL